jgi:hypothetical protein
MATKLNKMLYSFDPGNGECQGQSSEVRDLVHFEPVIAPITTRRGLKKEDEKPTFSLRTDETTLVFGVDDVYEHGQRNAIRRLNSQTRYASDDYFRLIDVLYLHTFAGSRGNSEPITPTGVISVPVKIYNEQSIIDQLRNRLVGRRELSDYDGCTLRLEVSEKRLLIVPESYGAVMHYAYDPKNFQKRPDADTSGSTVVVDIGYETTDVSLFEGLKFQRDQADSILRTGMGMIARSVQAAVEGQGKNIDASRIDRALRPLANKAPGALKEIEPVPGICLDVTEAYDVQIEYLAARIAQEVLTRFNEAANRILLAGGGAFHLERALRAHFAPLTVERCPQPQIANCVGAFTMLSLQASR